MIPVFLLGSVAFQVWAWRRLVARVQDGLLTRLQASARYLGCAFLPVAFFVGVFFAMVGLEEWIDVALVEERGALLAIPVLALAIVGGISFAVRIAFVPRLRSR